MDEISPDHRVLAVDSYGSGRSPDWHSELEISLRDEVDFIEPVLALAGAPVALVGHSYGGAVALLAALADPGRVRALAIYEPTLFALVDAAHPPPNGADGIRNAVSAAGAALDAGDRDGSPGPARAISSPRDESRSREPHTGTNMQLIGMLDSPYVRRVAISLQLLGLAFEHESVSVFRGFTRFEQINPIVKAPTLVCDDGATLMDSTLILEYAEAMARPRTLMPAELAELRHELKIIGLALAACEKSVQIIYEQSLRPAEKVHEPWLARITGQLLAAYRALDIEMARRPLAGASQALGQAGVTTAVAWHFTQRMHPEVVPAGHHPALAAFSEAAEALPEFRAASHGNGTYRHAG